MINDHAVITSAKEEVIGSVRFVCQSVCHSVCVQDYCKRNEPITLTLGVMNGPSDRKNLLTFGGDPVPDTDHFSTSLTVAE